MKQQLVRLVPALSGALFAAGLALSGMTHPAKVQGFLDITGDWDPALVFVMVGAIGVYSLVYWTSRGGKAWTGASLESPSAGLSIDRRLAVGSVLFGVGWGISGYCPGPAFTSLGATMPDVAVFLVSMLAGMWFYESYDRAKERAEAAVEAAAARVTTAGNDA